MTQTINLWLESDHHTAFRCGGWAWVLADGAAVLGAAGGERTASPERIALAGLADAFKALPPAGDVRVHSRDPYVAAVPRRIAGPGEAPFEDLDYWAPISRVLQGRTVRFVTARAEARTPTAFAAAWAELSRDKAKASGAFRAAIPKPNLAKAGVPA